MPGNAFIFRVQSKVMALSKETQRKLFHLAAGVAFAFLVYEGIASVWVLAAITLAGFIVSAAMRRRRLPVIEWFLRRMERDDAMATFPGRGAFFFFCGMLITVAIFPRDVAAASIMVLAIGDSVAPLAWKQFVRNRKHVTGRAIPPTVVGLLAAAAGAWAFVPLQDAFAAAAAGMAIEAIDSIRGRRIEDNITMPIAAGIAIMLLRILAPYF
jgi:dolichol kinase